MDVPYIGRDMTEGEMRAYTLGIRKGMVDGMRRFAWWKDGVEMVGTCGTTLTKAIDDLERDFDGTLRDLNTMFRALKKESTHD